MTELRSLLGLLHRFLDGNTWGLAQDRLCTDPGGQKTLSVLLLAGSVSGVVLIMAYCILKKPFGIHEQREQ